MEQRYKIETYLENGKSQTEISVLLGVHKSTICRELKRNIPKRGFGSLVYAAINAQKKTNLRHFEKTKHIKFNEKLKLQMKKWMEVKRFSPEIISAQWKKNNVDGVSYETIYKFLWNCKHSNHRKNRIYKDLHKFLKHGKRRRKRGNYKDSRGLIPNRISIDKRSKMVERRKRLGDYECDLIMGKNHKSSLLVITERSTLRTTINKLKSKNSINIANKIISRMKNNPNLKTMTFDNDQAFSKHEKIAEVLSIKTYFARPYTSQDKGTVENRNGLIRQFFPKKTDFNLIDEKEIKRVESVINDRPVRKFGYLTPNEVFLQKKVSVALIH